MNDPPPTPDEAPTPEGPPRVFSRLGKWAWAVIGVFAAFGIFLIGFISSGGTGCKDKAGNATTCSSGGGHGGSSSYVGGTSSTTTARGGFGSTGAAHAGGGE